MATSAFFAVLKESLCQTMHHPRQNISMASTKLSCFLVTSLVFSLLLPLVAPDASRTPSRIVVKLIHRNSLSSPYYNPAATTKDLALFASESSRARLAYLRAKATGDIRAAVIAEDNARSFMANFSIGNPPVPQLVCIDTGSHRLWIKCLPCDGCSQQDLPVFDPSKSNTYQNAACGTPVCPFSVNYMDGTQVKGVLGRETLTFQTSDDGIVSISNVDFGCGHETAGFPAQLSGILGLGPNPESLARRLGSKFSYCFARLRDPRYPHNRLILGDGLEAEGDSTPLQIRNSFYYLVLQGISIGERMLEIDPFAFQETGGTLIDTGCTLTLLNREAWETLEIEVTTLLEGKLQREAVRDRRFKLCYRGSVQQDLTGFPVVTFHFSGGAELGLDVESLFIDYGLETFCMAIDISEDENVIGVMAQQSYNVAYDLQAMKVYFQRIDCQLLEG